jgi:hypothetical protein
VTVPIWRVRTNLIQSAGNPLLSTMYFPGDPIVTPLEAVTAVGAFWGLLGDAMSETCTWAVEAEVASIDASTGDLIDLENAGSTFTGAGTLTGQPLPPANQALIRWKTSSIVAGRQLQGRTFIPGMTENLNDDGTPNAGLVALCAAAADSMFSVGTGAISIFSHTHNVAALATSASVYPQYAVLRSRRT